MFWSRVARAIIVIVAEIPRFSGLNETPATSTAHETGCDHRRHTLPTTVMRPSVLPAAHDRHLGRDPPACVAGVQREHEQSCPFAAVLRLARTLARRSDSDLSRYVGKAHESRPGRFGLRYDGRCGHEETDLSVGMKRHLRKWVVGWSVRYLDPLPSA